MSTHKTFSPKELAPIIGVSQSSIKRWVDAGRIEVTRTAGGHRRIALDEALRFIRKQEMRVLRPDLLGLPDLQEITTPVPPEQLTGDMLLRVLESDEALRARSLITAAFLDDQQPAALFDGPIKEAMTVLGERWKTDDCGIYLEHQATQLVLEAINQIQLLIPPPPYKTLVAVGCAPQHDPYILPSMMAQVVLADGGYRTTNLGANTPAQTVLDAVTVQQAHIVWIAVTSGHAFVDDLHEWEHVITTLLARDVRVVLGGQGLARLAITWPQGVHIMQTMTDLAAFATDFRRTYLHRAGSPS